MTRQAALDELRGRIDDGRPIIGVPVGSGLSAKSAEAGGCDLIIVNNAGRYRMAGHASLAGYMPYGDANEILVEMATEVLPVVRDAPVIAGVCASDPFRLMPVLLRQLKDLGICGIQNFPTMGLVDGRFRDTLELAGLGYARELDLMRQAHDLDMLTMPYVFTREQAIAMVSVGADVLVATIGLSQPGVPKSDALEDGAGVIQEIRDAAIAVREDVIVLCHGGPIAEPEDVAWILEQTEGIAGVFGAASTESAPIEAALTGATAQFTALRMPARQR